MDSDESVQVCFHCGIKARRQCKHEVFLRSRMIVLMSDGNGYMSALSIARRELASSGDRDTQ